jgi:hypothetical protein
MSARSKSANTRNPYWSTQLSKRLADSDLVVIELTRIGPIRKISVLDWFLPYWPNESFYIVYIGLVIGPRPAVLA